MLDSLLKWCQMNNSFRFLLRLYVNANYNQMLIIWLLRLRTLKILTFKYSMIQYGVFFSSDSLHLSKISTARQKWMIIAIFSSHCNFYISNRSQAIILWVSDHLYEWGHRKTAQRNWIENFQQKSQPLVRLFSFLIFVFLALCGRDLAKRNGET